MATAVLARTAKAHLRGAMERKRISAPAPAIPASLMGLWVLKVMARNKMYPPPVNAHGLALLLLARLYA
jgi:hypothetical protein